MNLTQTQIQTHSKPTAAEIIAEIAETYVNERGWADVMDIKSILYAEDSKVIGDRLYNEMIDIAGNLALKDKHCYFCGEELVRIHALHRKFRCYKCWEDWDEDEVGQNE